MARASPQLANCSCVLALTTVYFMPKSQSLSMMSVWLRWAFTTIEWTDDCTFASLSCGPRKNKQSTWIGLRIEVVQRSDGLTCGYKRCPGGRTDSRCCSLVTSHNRRCPLVDFYLWSRLAPFGEPAVKPAYRRFAQLPAKYFMRYLPLDVSCSYFESIKLGSVCIKIIAILMLRRGIL